MPVSRPEPAAPELPATPAQLIHARIDAFRRCDFGFIYDTYHFASNFRRQFPDRDDYVRYGWASLGKEFRISACSIIREELDGDSARVIYLLEFEMHGESQRYAELAWMVRAENGWTYRCGQKMLPDEWPVPGARLDFGHFDQVPDKVIY